MKIEILAHEPTHQAFKVLYKSTSALVPIPGGNALPPPVHRIKASQQERKF